MEQATPIPMNDGELSSRTPQRSIGGKPFFAIASDNATQPRKKATGSRRGKRREGRKENHLETYRRPEGKCLPRRRDPKPVMRSPKIAQRAAPTALHSFREYLWTLKIEEVPAFCRNVLTFTFF
jgi:hypothetical protein